MQESDDLYWRYLIFFGVSKIVSTKFTTFGRISSTFTLF